ncbi:hypothetical protein FHX81_5349 [Saccharothrix saharensis]|uniref:Excisionase family DNA binding protein n=1 Tax=Saccharothrix saharensis TaxID=571190 RepID=A0A543JJA3_9PSEU|nr:helix-turn-helix domain-containing protein [Saccharothrix saharensis]TQM82937.1 hypothetical protein FHX81_5349 [Saccharothrix saharensis]
MNTFTVKIDLDAPEPTSDQVDVLMDLFEEYHCTWGMSHDRLRAQLTIPGATFLQAAHLAGLVVGEAVERAGYGSPPVVAITVMTEAEFERREAEHDIPDLLSTEEVAIRLGISRQAVVKRAAKLGGKKVGDRAWVFDAAVIDELIEENG